MSQRGDHFLLPISARRFLRHDVHISVIQLDDASIGDRFTSLKPHEMQGHGQADTDTDNFLAFRVAMEANAAFARLVVIIPFHLQIFRHFPHHHFELVSHSSEIRDIRKTYDSTFLALVIRIVPDLLKTEVVARMLVHDLRAKQVNTGSRWTLNNKPETRGLASQYDENERVNEMKSK